MERWQKRGRMRELLGRGIFTIDEGRKDAPPVLFLHGFPTCSYDWKDLVPHLAGYRLLMLDFLGYGLSDKPLAHGYSLFEQADLAEAFLRDAGVGEVDIVCHDMGNSVALELFRRRQVRSFAIGRTVMLNGSVWLAHYRPVLAQKLLLTPVVGEVAALAMNRPFFGHQLSKVFSPGHKPTKEELDVHWALIRHNQGQRNYARLIRYLTERRKYEERWMQALVDNADVPLTLLWGMRDPVSRPAIGRTVTEHRPDATWVPLENLGHYPQIEDPARVAGLIDDALKR